MDVIVDTLAALGLRLALVLADVDATDLNANDYAVGRFWMHAEISYVASLRWRGVCHSSRDGRS